MMTLNWGTKKIQTVGTISEFMNKNQAEETTIIKAQRKPNHIIVSAGANLLAASLTIPLLGTPLPVSAALTIPASGNVKQEVATKVMSAFQPLIDLVCGFSYPLTFVTFAIAGVTWIWNREKAISLMQGGMISFIAVQMTPLVMRLLTAVTAGF